MQKHDSFSEGWTRCTAKQETRRDQPSEARPRTPSTLSLRLSTSPDLVLSHCMAVLYTGRVQTAGLTLEFGLTHSLSYSCCLISSTALMPILYLSMAELRSPRAPSMSSLAIVGDGRLAGGPSFPGVQGGMQAGQKQTSKLIDATANKINRDLLEGHA